MIAAQGEEETEASGEAGQLFAQGYALEAADPEAALAAYAEAVKRNACLPGAHANRGRLLHELYPPFGVELAP